MMYVVTASQGPRAETAKKYENRETEDEKSGRYTTNKRPFSPCARKAVG